jgi:O-antigen/teichoic acid export membrane protein
MIKADLFWFVIVSLFDMILYAVFSILLYLIQRLPIFFKNTDLKIGKNLLKAGLPLMFSSFFTSLILGNVPILYLKHLNDDYYAAIFSVAYSIASLFTFITVVITSSLAPAITRSKLSDDYIYRERILDLNRFLVLIAVFISLLMAVISDKVIIRLYGTDYKEASAILKILIWTNIFIFLGNASWQWYINENKQGLALYRLAAGSFVMILFGYFLIKYYNALGASFAVLLSHFVAFYIGNVIRQETIDLFKIQTKALLSFYNVKSMFGWIRNEREKKTF